MQQPEQTTDYPLHELVRIFPEASPATYAELKQSIAAVGQLQPAMLHQGQLLDGKTRQQICRELGLELICQELPEKTHPVDYLLAVNLTGRNRNENERAIIASRLAQYYQDAGSKPQSAQRRAATQLKVTQKTVAHAARTLNPASRAVPALRHALETGNISLKEADYLSRQAMHWQQRALQEMAASPPGRPTTAQAAIKKLRRAEIRQTWEQQQAIKRNTPPSKDLTLYHSSCRELIGIIPQESIDLIVTDPPYQPETLSCYRDLADLAAHCLKEGGILLAMATTSHLPQVLQYLTSNDELTYNWTLNDLMEGANLRFHTRAVRMGWKPIIWLQKGRPDLTDRHDIIQAPALARQDVRYHQWGQNEEGFQLLLERFAFPGQTVLDPFVGGGTTLLAAQRLGCASIGADIDQDCLTTTRQRIVDYQAGIDN